MASAGKILAVLFMISFVAIQNTRAENDDQASEGDQQVYSCRVEVSI